MTTTDRNGVADRPAECVDWKDVWRRVENPRRPDTPRMRCLDPERCTAADPCSSCQTNERYAAELEEDRRALWFAKQRLFPALEMVRRLVKVYPAELAQAVRPVVWGVLDAWLEAVKPEAARMLQEEIAKRMPVAAEAAAAAIAAPGGTGPALRLRLTETLLPEIEDYLIDVVLGCMEAKAETPTQAAGLQENPDADTPPEQGEPL